MTGSQKRLFQIVALIVTIIVLIRFFPFAFRFVEGAALGVREFWWVILVLVLGIFAFRVLKKR